ncbi:MAG: hypothetical protein RLP02_07360 [Coleofasciculus sp. C2-GNP5-27]
MNKALLDTDIFSEVQKGRNSNIVTKARAYRDTFGSYTISVITVLEIIKGWHKRQRQDRIQQFLNVITDVEVLN